MFIQSYIYNNVKNKLPEYIPLEHPMAINCAKEMKRIHDSFLFYGAVEIIFCQKVLFSKKLETDNLLDTWISLLTPFVNQEVTKNELGNGLSISTDNQFIEYSVNKEVIELNLIINSNKKGLFIKETINIPFDIYKKNVIKGFNTFAEFLFNLDIHWSEDSSFQHFNDVYQYINNNKFI